MNDATRTALPDLGSHDLVSYTAIKILQKRAQHTEIPYAREMADAAGVHWRVSRTRAWLRDLIWGPVRSGLYLQFRHDAVSSALKAYPGSAVLEIGAGFGTRGLAESGEREAYIESDLGEVIERKPALVEAVLSGKPRPNHHFLQLNACSASDVEKAERFVLGLRLRRPLVIVNEGILMYLSDAEQRTFRDNVRSFLANCSPQGAWITTDPSERDSEESLVQRSMTRRLTRRVGRHFNRFRDDEVVGRFLAEGGLRGLKHANLREHDPDPEVRAVAESFRAWTISLT